MKLNVKKLIFACTFALCALGSLCAQQITKFAVVDTTRVYQAFFRNSAPVRNYENKKQEFQDQIDKYTLELQDLHNKKLDYDARGDSYNSSRIQQQIDQKTRFLTEYTRSKNEELQGLKQSLQDNDSFYKKLYDILEDVAESDGYSMVLSLQQANAILWYSPSVDITDDVIRQLGLTEGN